MATAEGHAEIAAFLKSKGGLTSEEEIERPKKSTLFGSLLREVIWTR